MKRLSLIAMIGALLTITLPAQGTRTLYVVSTAHLDSQWNWTVQDTIRDYLPKTLRTNFDYFEKYPEYVFNWEGAIHYMWMKEYYPAEWQRLLKYVAAGRWRVSGSWVNAVDVNMPSPESLFRHALYGQRFFRQEFDKTSRDIYLPDCFGFGFALPSIAAHSGLKSFSTQKLTWGRPIPFPVGRWTGVDGSTIVAALDPKDYVTQIRGDTDITTDPAWTNQFTPLGDGNSVAFRYVGTGDTGGAPTEESVRNLVKAMTKTGASVKVVNTAADQLVRDLNAAQVAALPEYKGELLLKTHGTGCYTSQAAMKKFNRENELLADSAERAAAAAHWLANLPYPSDRLREAWTRVLWHQFHDDLTGTCIPQAYQFSWNDEIASLNQFAGVLTSSMSAVAQTLDTQGNGVPLVVYNPLAMTRRDVVEANVEFAGVPPASVKVTDASTGREIVSQVLSRTANSLRILFLAEVPSVGFKVFHVSNGVASGFSRKTESGDFRLKAEAARSGDGYELENNRITVRIDRNGDIAAIYDKDAKHELLSAPVMLELRDNPSPPWPAWEVLYETVSAAAREYLTRPTVRIVEKGPVRVAVEITRRASGSTFVQYVRLTEGGDRIDVENHVDWKSTNTLLKASFPLAASNPKATYDLGLGTIERTNNEPDKYEVPAQKWADVTDVGGSFGVGVINDSKHGWDKPTDNTLRLTLIHTPRPATGYTYQSSNDLGRHRFTFAIAGHAGDWRRGRLPIRAAQLNQPLVAFQSDTHPGPMGRSFSILSTDNLAGQVAIAALKKAEDSDELIVRLQEQYGLPVRATLRLPSGVLAAREVNAAEEEVGPFALPPPQAGRGGGPPTARPTVPVDLKPYQPRTIALKLAPPAQTIAATRTYEPLSLPFNLDGVTSDNDRADGDFDGRRRTIAAELLPPALSLNGIPFTFGSGATGAKNVLVPKGERIQLPNGSFNRVYVIAAAVGGDVSTSLVAVQPPRSPKPTTPASAEASARSRRGASREGGHHPPPLTVREWQAPIGQWDSRLKEPSALREPFVPASAGRGGTPSRQEIQDGLVVQWDPQTGEVSGIENIRRGFVKRDEIAWIGTHRHAPDGNQIYVASYLFVYAIDLPEGTRALTLPANERLRIMAMTAAREPRGVRPARALYASDLPDR
jgi:alpha-mannosidase